MGFGNSKFRTDAKNEEGIKTIDGKGKVSRVRTVPVYQYCVENSSGHHPKLCRGSYSSGGSVSS